MLTPIAIGMPSGAQWIVIAAIGLILFGKRLPEVGRSLGKGIVEFKKGLSGVAEEIRQVDLATTPDPTPTPAIPAAPARPTAGAPAAVLPEEAATASAPKPTYKFD